MQIPVHYHLYYSIAWKEFKVNKEGAYPCEMLIVCEDYALSECSMSGSFTLKRSKGDRLSFRNQE